MPEGVLTTFDRVYPFGWLGILAEAAPSSEELIYAYHDRGFGLLSMRSPHIGRLYLQCNPDEDIANWPDEKIWRELHTRLETDEGWKLTEGPIIQKGVTGMRSFVSRADAMRQTISRRRCRAHRPADRRQRPQPRRRRRSHPRACASRISIRHGRRDLLETYSQTCLRRVWKVQRFSWWMTSMLHRFDDENAFDHRRQLAELDYVTSSRAASQTLAENYVGLPLE